jgi:hypothetical protein
MDKKELEDLTISNLTASTLEVVVLMLLLLMVCAALMGWNKFLPKHHYCIKVNGEVIYTDYIDTIPLNPETTQFSYNGVIYTSQDVLIAWVDEEKSNSECQAYFDFETNHDE